MSSNDLREGKEKKDRIESHRHETQSIKMAARKRNELGKNVTMSLKEKIFLISRFISFSFRHSSHTTRICIIACVITNRKFSILSLNKNSFKKYFKNLLILLLLMLNWVEMKLKIDSGIENWISICHENFKFLSSESFHWEQNSIE